MTNSDSAPNAVSDNDVFLQAVCQFGAGQPMRTLQAIYNTEGMMLLAADMPVDQNLYERLRSHRLARPVDECVEAEESVNAAALREAAEAALERWPFFALMAPAGRMRSTLLEAVSGIPLPKPIALHLTVARTNKPPLYRHSILMGLLCAHLVRESGGTLQDMIAAAAAGILHDIGMMYIDPALLDSGALLSGDELNPLYAHPLTSAIIMKRFPQYPKMVLRAVVEHHERLDGSGYPRSLGGAEMSSLGRLVSLAEVVTAMFDDERQYPEQRVSLLLRISPRRYDATLVPSIHRLLRALPPPAADAAAPATESVERLRRLDALLTHWRDAVASMLPQLAEAERLLLQPVSEQTETLQRMLYEAGITPDQLGLVADDAGSDPLLRIELWALEQELQWQLRAMANQLQRRWGAAEATPALPSPLREWLDDVKALAAPLKA